MRLPLSISACILVIANLIPIWGVLNWGWDAGKILQLYWMENVIYGLINLPKILTARGQVPGDPSPARQPSLASRIFLSVFFTLHYGLFTLVHGIFIMDYTAQVALDESSASAFFLGPFEALTFDQALILSLVGLVLSHLTSLVINWFGRAEYQRTSPHQQMVAPYGRVVILHVAIIFGGMMVISMGSPLPALVILIAAKIVIDLIAHTLSHRKRRVSNLAS